MRRSVASSIVVLSVLIVTTFGVLIGASLLNDDVPQTSRTEAQSPDDICPMNIRAYVHEIADDGTEITLNFDENDDLAPDFWGLVDSRRTQTEPILFNKKPEAIYDTYTTSLSFDTFPLDEETYLPGNLASVTLAYQGDAYDIVRKEITKCRNSNGDWVCENDNPSPDIATISNLYMDCGVDLEFGWVVTRTGTPQEVSSGTNFFATLDASTLERLDINGDGAYNTLDLLLVIVSYTTRGPDIPADVNSDGVVNALDYTLVVEAIENSL